MCVCVCVCVQVNISTCDDAPSDFCAQCVVLTNTIRLCSGCSSCVYRGYIGADGQVHQLEVDFVFGCIQNDNTNIQS